MKECARAVNKRTQLLSMAGEKKKRATTETIARHIERFYSFFVVSWQCVAKHARIMLISHLIYLFIMFFGCCCCFSVSLRWLSFTNK